MNVVPDDIIQLGHSDGTYYHTLFIVDMDQTPLSETDYQHVYVAAHDYDAWHKSLSEYSFSTCRCLHIEGVH